MAYPIPVEVVDRELLEEENMRLRMDLDECKTQLYDLLYEENTVSDAALRKEYGKICELIEAWIEEGFKDVEFSLKLRSVFAENARELMHLGLIPMDKDPTTEGAWRIDLLSAQDTCKNIVISHVTWRFLIQRIFDKPFPIGATEDQVLLLSEILDLKNQETDQGPALRTTRWRSETLNAMLETPGFKKRQARELDFLIKDLREQLKYWGEVSPSSHQEYLMEDLLRSSLRLHSWISCSKRRYIFKAAKLTPDPRLPKENSWTLQDIQKWREVKYNAIDSSYRVISHLSPGLYRYGQEIGEDLEVVKPVVVVYKVEQQHSRPPSQSPTRDESRHADKFHRIRDRYPRRLTHSINNTQSGRKNDSGNYTSLTKYLWGPKTKNSELKPKNTEFKSSGPKIKSAANQHSGHKSRRRSKSHSPSKEDHTRPIAQRDQTSDLKPIRSYTEPPLRSSDRIEVIENSNSRRVDVNSASQSISRIPPGTPFSETVLDTPRHSLA